MMLMEHASHIIEFQTLISEYNNKIPPCQEPGRGMAIALLARTSYIFDELLPSASIPDLAVISFNIAYTQG
jgi:hypothetical protein